MNVFRPQKNRQHPAAAFTSTPYGLIKIKLNTLYHTSKTLREKLSDGRICLGLFHLTSSAIVSEVLAATTIDWLACDLEASPSGKMNLVHFLQSMKASPVTAVVRTESSATQHLEQVLDTGVCAIIIPKVTTREQCLQIVDAVKYPPMGKRGVNPVRASGYFADVKGYFASANSEILTFVQIESGLAVQHASEILSVDGIDGAFIGCGDLAMDLGCPGEMTSPVLLSAIDQVLAACNASKKVPGIFAYDMKLAQKFIADGFRMIAFGNDIGMLQKSVNNDYNQLSQAAAKTAMPAE